MNAAEPHVIDMDEPWLDEPRAEVLRIVISTADAVVIDTPSGYFVATDLAEPLPSCEDHEL